MELMSSDCVMLCEENAPNCGGQVSGFCITTSRPHSIECAAVSHEKRDDNGFTPPYSPDLAPCNFFLFPRMKRDRKEKRFQNVEVREKTTEALKAITLQEFHNCFKHWKKRWDKCIDSQGEYFEGD